MDKLFDLGSEVVIVFLFGLKLLFAALLGVQALHMSMCLVVFVYHGGHGTLGLVVHGLDILAQVLLHVGDIFLDIDQFHLVRCQLLLSLPPIPGMSGPAWFCASCLPSFPSPSP